MHKLRLTNNSKYPLTTAPALILRDGRVLAQGMMTYTATGADVDLAITTAVTGLVSLLVGLYAQMISATRELRVLIVTGIIAGFVGLALGLAHGGFS